MGRDEREVCAVSKMSRAKGVRGEREWASVCREKGYAAVRTAQHAGKDGGEPDVKGLPGIHAEVKRTEALRLHDAIAQAVRDAKPEMLPMVAHRRNRDSWLVTMRAKDWFAIYREWEAGRTQ